MIVVHLSESEKAIIETGLITSYFVVATSKQVPGFSLDVLKQDINKIAEKLELKIGDLDEQVKNAM